MTTLSHWQRRYQEIPLTTTLTGRQRYHWRYPTDGNATGPTTLSNLQDAIPLMPTLTLAISQQQKFYPTNNDSIPVIPALSHRQQCYRTDNAIPTMLTLTPILSHRQWHYAIPTTHCFSSACQNESKSRWVQISLRGLKRQWYKILTAANVFLAAMDLVWIQKYKDVAAVAAAWHDESKSRWVKILSINYMLQ